ncbi:MAG TPA: type II CAAX endopeptidase family protein [Pyrinomonadaceae bacterium]|nr:type II CAAX endopeptidase family protein [Pyrinomonadaceae bacterium]
MGLHQIFFNEYGRLRSGFRLLIFTAVFIFFSILLTEAVRLGYALLHNYFPSGRFASFFQNLFFRFSLVATALIAGYVCTRFLEGLPWRSLGLTLHAKWVRDLIVGSLVGIASLAMGVGVAATGGGLNFTLNTGDAVARVMQSLVGSGILFIVAALGEEAIFRGYPIQTLTRAHFAWLGVLLTSLGFASAHLFNPNVVPRFSFLNTALAGIWLGVAYLRTRSLWFPLGIHWGWNWALGSLFGLPVSGLHLVGAPLLSANDIGPEWLTGGSYGLEGGIAGTVAMLLATVLTWMLPFVAPTPELLKLTSEEVPVGPKAD